MPAFDVTYYDGRTATPHPARASCVGRRLVVSSAADEALGAWDLAEVRLLARARDGLPGRIRLGRDGEARLTFTHPGLASQLIQADRRVAGDRFGEFRRGLRRIALPLVLAVAGVVLLFTVVLPMLAPVIARQIPVETERRLGAATADAVLALFAQPPRRICATPAGSAALDALVARLVAAAPMAMPLRVRVANAPMVNAFAMPGGEVLVFRGLIDFAQSPEELAGVLAHELAHVALRHPLEMAIRRTTTSVVMGLIFGDVVGLSLFGGVASQLVSSSYSREFEEAADDAGLARLRQAAIDGSGQARLMERLAAREPRDEGGMLPSLLATHPPPAARAAQARASDWPSTPALSAAQWQALRAICAPPAPPNTRG